jgi:hypothetical protein
MKVGLWAEIRRLAEIERLSGRQIARRLHCSRDTVAAALAMSQPPTADTRRRRTSLLEPFRERIDDLLARSPELSAVRIQEELARGPQGYTGGVSILRRYLRAIRPARGRVYQEVNWEPAQAMQVDWGECGRVPVGSTTRKVSVFVAVLCYSRMINHLTTAQINGLLGQALKTYTRPSLLLLDELGYLPIDKRGADLLFQVVAARYESGSIVLTTNRAFREWGALFDVDNTLATALIDRLMHHGEALVIRGDSYRMKDKDSDPPSE